VGFTISTPVESKTLSLILSKKKFSYSAWKIFALWARIDKEEGALINNKDDLPEYSKSEGRDSVRPDRFDEQFKKPDRLWWGKRGVR